MANPGESVVLEEEVDETYEPTREEIVEYAKWLGMDTDTEQELFWIAREGLKAPLPKHWKPCRAPEGGKDGGEIYYFNFNTGESTWEHPCDEYYRNVYAEEKTKKEQAKKDGGKSSSAAAKTSASSQQAPAAAKQAQKQKQGKAPVAEPKQQPELAPLKKKMPAPLASLEPVGAVPRLGGEPSAGTGTLESKNLKPKPLGASPIPDAAKPAAAATTAATPKQQPAPAAAAAAAATTATTREPDQAAAAAERRRLEAEHAASMRALESELQRKKETAERDLDDRYRLWLADAEAAADKRKRAAQDELDDAMRAHREKLTRREEAEREELQRSHRRSPGERALRVPMERPPPARPPLGFPR